jgi:HAE1 family hydrophobic/amphiphilic exporter-1
MVSLYDSFAHPFVVLFAIPLSFIGALALALTNNTLNIFTILEVIMLIGLVCKMRLCLWITPISEELREASEPH